MARDVGSILAELSAKSSTKKAVIKKRKENKKIK
jgi:hypothetical protein